MSLGREAIEWLTREYSDSPPKGWYSVSEIAEKRGVTMAIAKRQLDKFLKSGQIKESRKFKIGNSIKTFYNLDGFSLKPVADKCKRA